MASVNFIVHLAAGVGLLWTLYLYAKVRAQRNLFAYSLSGGAALRILSPSEFAASLFDVSSVPYEWDIEGQTHKCPVPVREFGKFFSMVDVEFAKFYKDREGEKMMMVCSPCPFASEQVGFESYQKIVENAADTISRKINVSITLKFKDDS